MKSLGGGLIFCDVFISTELGAGLGLEVAGSIRLVRIMGKISKLGHSFASNFLGSCPLIFVKQILAVNALPVVGD